MWSVSAKFMTQGAGRAAEATPQGNQVVVWLEKSQKLHGCKPGE